MIFAPQRIKMIKIDDINPNPYQIRRNFNLKKLEQLSNSIKEVGILCPLIVRSAAKGYEVICGQRRLRAALLAGMKSVPAFIVRAGDRQCAQLSMIENLQRENITFFEEAEGYYNLMSYHGVKKEELAKKLSVENGEISGKVRLLGIEPSVKYKIEESGISENAAKELLRLRDGEKQKEIIEKVAKGEINLKEMSSIIKESIREATQSTKDGKRGRKKAFNLPLCINTVKKTADMLKKSGAKVEMEQKEDEKYIEFTLKISK